MGSFFNLLKPSERSLHTAFGRWAIAVSGVMDGDPTANSPALLDLLYAAGGEVPLRSPLGQWALAVSKSLSCGSSNQTSDVIAALHASGLVLGSPFGVWATAVSSGSILNAIVPPHVLTSPLDGKAIAAPAVVVNQDEFGMSQEEPSVAVDPTNPNRIVVGMITAETAAWDCKVNGAPCGAVFGTQTLSAYLSTDGGKHWCCASSSPAHPGGLLPNLVLATGNTDYNATFDPSVAFDSVGHVYVAGEALQADLTNPDIPPTASAISVNKGTWNGSTFVFQPAVFINPAAFPFINDKPWLAVDKTAASPFANRIYVAWTIITLGPMGPTDASIFFSFSSDGGQTFSAPAMISGLEVFSTGARPFVAPNGDLYVVFVGTVDPTTTLPSVWVVKSVNGGGAFGAPVKVADVTSMLPPHDTVFRAANSPAAAVAPNGDLYVTWVLEVLNSAVTFGGNPLADFNVVGEDQVRATCHSVAVYSKSVNGGVNWSLPALVFTPGTRTAEGYPVTSPDGSVLNAPAGIPIDDVMPALAISAAGDVYVSAYRSTLVSPWQLCAEPGQPVIPVGDISCLQLGNYVDNGRLEYFVQKIGGATQKLSTHPINSRYGFGGGFFGDYTDIAIGSDAKFHAVWTDTNSVKPVHFYGPFEFNPGCSRVHNQEIATRSGS